MKLNLCNEEIHLLPERAFFWPKEKILGLSDIHIGKAESFQALGVPLPSGSHLEDLDKISKIIKTTGTERVYILGDLIHQKNSWTPQIIEDLSLFFIKHKKVEWTLLIGNHERGSISQLQRFPINLREETTIKEPFVLTHGHLKPENLHQFFIQGHIHPVVRIREGSTKLRLPCFVVDKNSLTLPSFGSLTGGYEVTAMKDRQIFATTGSSIFEVPS